MEESTHVRNHSEVEQAWLAYARSVLTDAPHIARCRALGGSPALLNGQPKPGVDDVDLRWPGYLGADAVPGKLVLIVSNVHRNFASGRVSDLDRDRLVSQTRAWRDGLAGDSEYLAAVRDVYGKGLTGGWTVSNWHLKTLKKLGVEASQIAYVNAARCQFPEPDPKLLEVETLGGVKRDGKRTKTRLKALCLERFPMRELEQFLRPRIALFTSMEAYDQATKGSNDPAITRLCYNQLNGNLTRPLFVDGTSMPKKTPWKVWSEFLASTGEST